MLTRLRIKNFKAWGDELWAEGVELAPITLFLGPNSAGKTSLLQVPLLLKQTFESPDRTLDLNLGGQAADLVDVGTAESILHTSSQDRELGLGLTLGHTFQHSATYIKNNAALTLNRLELVGGERAFSASRQAKGGYLLEAPGYVAKTVGNRADARRTFQPERSLAFSADAVAELGAVGAEVQDLALRIRQEVSTIAYLGPLREPPERSYMWSGVVPGDLGKRGEKAVHALLASDDTKKKQREGVEGGAQWLVDRVSEWLRRLGVADRLVLEQQGRSRHYELHILNGSQTANIMDVGFGISQVLPMLVLAYFVPRGTTIVAEQPEIHLHPRAQVGLAELMVEVAKSRGVQFLIETHSEHLFRRLQTLIADQRLSSDDCRLYFVDRDASGATQLTTLAVDAYGRVQNWPKDFFGDVMGETERQMRRMIERMKRAAPGAHDG
jgi:predicted ATPase